MKMMDELIALNKRLAEIIEANSDTSFIASLRAAGNVIKRPENFTRAIYGGEGAFEFYELHTPVAVAHDWTLPVGTVLALDNKFCEIIENKVLAVDHEDPVITLTDASLGIPEILNAEANTRFIVNDLDVRYSWSMGCDPVTLQGLLRRHYIISGITDYRKDAENDDEPLVNVTYCVQRVFNPGRSGEMPCWIEKPFVEISIFGQPDAKSLPSKYQLIVDALMVNEANR